MRTYTTALTSITSLYERLVYRSYGLHGSKHDDDDDIYIGVINRRGGWCPATDLSSFIMTGPFYFF